MLTAEAMIAEIVGEISTFRALADLVPMRRDSRARASLHLERL